MPPSPAPPPPAAPAAPAAAAPKPPPKQRNYSVPFKCAMAGCFSICKGLTMRTFPLLAAHITYVKSAWAICCDCASQHAHHACQSPPPANLGPSSPSPPRRYWVMLEMYTNDLLTEPLNLDDILATVPSKKTMGKARRLLADVSDFEAAEAIKTGIAQPIVTLDDGNKKGTKVKLSVTTLNLFVRHPQPLLGHP